MHIEQHYQEAFYQTPNYWSSAPSIVFTDRKKENKPQYPKPQTKVKLSPVEKKKINK